MRINSKHADSDRGLDAYFTPVEAITSLIHIERDNLPESIWEPACGDGAISRPLLAAGYKVYSSDIADYGFTCSKADYLTTHEPEVLKAFNIGGIVTNPPFKLAIEFATKALSEVPYVALLLRTNFLESTSRLGFFRTYPPKHIWMSSRRLPQMHRFGWTGPRASSNIAFSWFIWKSGFHGHPTLDWFDWSDYTTIDIPEPEVAEW